MNILLLTFFAFVLSFLGVFLLIRYAQKLGFVDIPNARSAHTDVMPRSAGLGFVLAVLLTPLLIDTAFFIEYYYIFLSILIILIAGVLDDKYDVSPKVKFIFIFAATLVLYFNNIEINSLGSYFGVEIVIPGFLVFIFTFFAVAGFTNALNLMDGLDGLAGSIALVMFVSFFAIGWVHDDVLMINLSALYIGALAAFLYFNWNPAKIFMGDSGSLALGFSIALLSIQSLHYVEPTAVLFLLALPIFDTFIVMRRRIQRGLSPFEADKTHLHHLLYKVKLHVKFTTVMLICMQITFSIMGYQMHSANNTLTLILFVTFFYIFLNLFDERLRYREKEKKNTLKRRS